MFEASVDDFGGAIAGVGVVEVGRGMSLDRRLSVLRSVMSSVRSLGTRVEVSVLIPACISALPRILLDHDRRR